MGRGRTIERLRALGSGERDLVALWRDAAPLLAELVPHLETPCFFTVDPLSLLTTSHFQEGMLEIPAEWLGREYAEPDFNGALDVLRSDAGVGTLHDATGGRPERSRKFHEEMQLFGCDQELVFALRTPEGQNWGLVGLYRLQGEPLFDDEDLAAVRAVAPALAVAARQALLVGQGSEPDLPHAPGVVLVDRALGVVAASPTADRWLDELGGSRAHPPAALLTAAGQALAEGRVATARVLSATGRWLVLHGSPMGADGASVVVDEATPSHVASLLMQAHGLTPREQEVAGAVLRGRSTAQVARDLAITENTVQEHLKRIFTKTGVRSRRELVSLVFHRYYVPRVRDNEARTVQDRPARGGPFPYDGSV